MHLSPLRIPDVAQQRSLVDHLQAGKLVLECSEESLEVEIVVNFRRRDQHARRAQGFGYIRDLCRVTSGLGREGRGQENGSKHGIDSHGFLSNPDAAPAAVYCLEPVG
jgi:hypothetical protein